MTLLAIGLTILFLCLYSEGKADAINQIKSDQKRDDLLLGYLAGKQIDD
ncbi:MAG: hypothetical protein KQ78_01987 [Candidatus Izimaplasma bacterium HR2]|nr:MAG: hypothetical protein KQ78_01987 [Candidatus Izimaplasma bacterium HR2]